MLQHLAGGLTALGNGPAIAYLFAGSLIGMFIGVVPGLGGIVVMSIVLAFINHINLTGTLCLFLATQAGSYFSASITSILLNTPAHPEAFAVTFDGFPMAQRGEGGRAIGISATSTCIGGFVGCAVFLGFIQFMNDLPGWFLPPEYVALIAIAMLLVSVLGTDAVSKALISLGMGLMIAAIGPSPVTGDFRFTFGAVGLYSGVALVALALGAFAVPQMILLFGTGTTVARQDMTGRELTNTAPVALQRGLGRQVIGGIFETFGHWVQLIRAGIIGVLSGLIPGMGGFAANFLSYGIAQQSSKKRELFGTGIAEGIIAPEGSSLAKEAGGLVPLLGLSIPGGVGGALLLAALTLKDVRTGYGFSQTYPTLPYEMMWIIALGGLIGTTTGALAAPLLARVTRVPGPLLLPFILPLTIVGSFVSATAFFAVVEVLIFAVIGFVLRRLRYSIAVFVLGVVLGPTFEQNINLTREAYHWSFFKFPFADILFVIVIGILVLRAMELRRGAKRQRDAIERLSGDERIAAERLVVTARRPYPLLAALVSLCIFGLALYFALYGGIHYSLVDAIMPVIGGTLTALAALWRLPQDLGNYFQFRRERKILRGETDVSGERENGDRERQLATVVAEARVDNVEGPGPPPAAGGSTNLMRKFDTLETLGAQQVLAVERQVQKSIIDKSWGRHGQYTREAIAYTWVAALVAVCWYFGFLVGIPVFCTAYGLTSTGRVLPSFRKRAVYTLLVAVVMWAVAYGMLHAVNLQFTPVVHL